MKPIILKPLPPIEEPEIKVDEYVKAMKEAFPRQETELEVKKYLSEIGRKGGRVKSEAKAKAVRENGKRPKKPRKNGKNNQS